VLDVGIPNNELLIGDFVFDVGIPNNELLIGDFVFDVGIPNNELLIGDFVFDVGIPNNELVIEDSPSRVTMTASVTTAKTTLGHSATVTARDTAYQVRRP
jgi:hypothetical protein